jgi:hypothetical protein
MTYPPPLSPQTPSSGRWLRFLLIAAVVIAGFVTCGELVDSDEQAGSRLPTSEVTGPGLAPVVPDPVDVDPAEMTDRDIFRLALEMTLPRYRAEVCDSVSYFGLDGAVSVARTYYESSGDAAVPFYDDIARDVLADLCLV